jgi:hypothetical protein
VFQIAILAGGWLMPLISPPQQNNKSWEGKMILRIKNFIAELIKEVNSFGFKYRWGIRIKDFGERLGHIRFFRFHFLNWLAGPVINTGLRIKDSVLYRPVIGKVA